MQIFNGVTVRLYWNQASYCFMIALFFYYNDHAMDCILSRGTSWRKLLFLIKKKKDLTFLYPGLIWLNWSNTKHVTTFHSTFRMFDEVKYIIHPLKICHVINLDQNIRAAKNKTNVSRFNESGITWFLSFGVLFNPKHLTKHLEKS